MSNNSKEYRLVFSTDPELNRRCQKCKELLTECTCRPEIDTSSVKFTPVLRIEKAGRAGKTVTVIDQLPKSEPFLREWTTKIKKKCGSGGTFKIDRDCGVIEIQGDKREMIRQIFAGEKIKSKG